MTGTAVGARKRSAAALGLSLGEYEARRSRGEKWCLACREWHPTAAFVRDRSRYDGLKSTCLVSARGQAKRPRDPQHVEAQRRVAVAVRYRRLPPPNSLPCTDCGHQWADGERRHEYDHHLGYEEEHMLDVQPVCTLCHADREKRRRRG